MVKTHSYPGLRFHPTDVELLMYYLKRKVLGRRNQIDVISEIDIYKYSPWELPDKSLLRSGDLEWYFFAPRARKSCNTARMNRATECGYWKATGKDRPVIYNNRTVGMVKILVFHLGKAPKGQRTNWVMHEYRLEDKNLADAGVVQDTYALCKVFHKNGHGPQNGAQYGAPLKEEEWEEEEDVRVNDALVLPSDPNTSIVTVAEDVIWKILDADVSTSEVQQRPDDDGDLVSMMRWFTEDTGVAPDKQIVEVGNKQIVEVGSSSNGKDIYNGLVDLCNLEDFCGNVSNFSSFNDARFVPNSNGMFLELVDLQSRIIFPAGVVRPKHEPN